jgi:hypothetical protein
MIYGNPIVHVDDDQTDKIGIRTLVASIIWQLSDAEIDTEDLSGEVPEAPAVSEDELLLVGIQTRRQGGGIYKTTWTWEGVDSKGGMPLKGRDDTFDFGFDPQLSQVSLKLWRGVKEDDSHAFDDLLTQFQGYPDPDSDQIIWPAQIAASTAKTGLSSSSLPAGTLNPMFGLQDFFRLEGTYKVRYAALNLPENLYEFAGLVTTDLPGNPPKIGQGRNWLKVPPKWKRRGLVHEIFETYWLSGIGGWPLPIYGDGK